MPQPKLPNLTDTDHLVFPENHPLHTHIVYDEVEREYYNIKTDIFLTDDDIKYHCLRPYSQIPCPLPTPLPTITYFIEWTNNEGDKEV